MTLKGGVKRKSGASVLFLVMIVGVLLFANYGILGHDLPEGWSNIPQMLVANNAGRGSPDSGEKMKPEKSSPWTDSSIKKQVDPVIKDLITKDITGKGEKMEARNHELKEKPVRQSKRISRVFEVLKQSNLVIEEILSQKK